MVPYYFRRISRLKRKILLFSKVLEGWIQEAVRDLLK